MCFHHVPRDKCWHRYIGASGHDSPLLLLDVFQNKCCYRMQRCIVSRYAIRLFRSPACLVSIRIFSSPTSRDLRRALCTHSLFLLCSNKLWYCCHVVADKRKLNWKKNVHTAMFIESTLNFGNTFFFFPLTLRPKLFCVAKIYFHNYINFHLETFLYLIFNIMWKVTRKRKKKFN